MARTSKSRGAVPFKMRSGNASPYKFLGKALRKVGGGVSKLLGGGKGAQKVGGFIGGGGLGGMALGAAGVPGAGMGAVGGGGGPMSGGPDPLGLGKGRHPGNMGMMAKVGMPFMQKERGYTPYKQTKASSPLKGADPILVSGARDAATGFGTAKYGQIAGARAWTDIVDTVEDTVNKGSKARLVKGRRAQKRADKSFAKYGKWHKRREERGRWDDSKEHPGSYVDWSS